MMNKIHKQRLFLVTFFIIGLGTATALILFALKQNINVFLTPSQFQNKTLADNYHFRLGGMVKPGSVQHSKTDLTIHFTITDYKKDVVVEFNGVLPDLFHEGKGAIAEGHLNQQHVFIANQILAKHDENYMPKQVYQALREGKEPKGDMK